LRNLGLTDINEDDLKKTVEVNLWGVIHGLECFVPDMIRAGNGGHIVTISSTAGIIGLPWHTVYAGTKHALVGMSEILRYDLKKHKIDVSVVCPGAVNAGLVKTVEIHADKEITDKTLAHFLKRAITPEKVAQQIISAIRNRKFIVITSFDIKLLFFFPKITKRYLLRVAVIAITAFIIFKFVFIPFCIQGENMAPTYVTGSFNFCFALRYLFSKPAPPDVVTVRMARQKIMLLKRVVATEGQSVEFREGNLFVDGKKVNEPYVAGKSDWNIPPAIVKPGHVYVVGDNRSMSARGHTFGQTPLTRIAGEPLW
jgi:signal peptidase I